MLSFHLETDISEYEYRIRKLVGHIVFQMLSFKIFISISLVFMLQNLFQEFILGCLLKPEWGIGERNEGIDGNVGNRDGNARNQGGNAGNQGDNAGNQGGNARNGDANAGNQGYSL